MQIIELAALENGAHKNQSGNSLAVPEGWAEIPDDVVVPDTWPFVGITLNSDGNITALTAGTVPAQEPEDTTPTAEQDAAAMIVDHEYRLTLLELGVTGTSANG